MSAPESVDSVKNSVIPAFIYILAVSTFAKPIPKNTVDSWQNLLKLVDQIDDDFDCATPEQKPIIAKSAVQFVTTASGLYAQSLLAQNVRNSIPVSKIPGFADDLQAQFATSQKLSETTDPVEYAKLTLQDGHIAALFFKYFLPENLQQNTSRIAIFETVLQKIGGIYKLIDSICDLKSDCRDGSTRISNQQNAKLQLKKQLISELVPAFIFSIPPNS